MGFVYCVHFDPKMEEDKGCGTIRVLQAMAQVLNEPRIDRKMSMSRSFASWEGSHFKQFKTYPAQDSLKIEQASASIFSKPEPDLNALKTSKYFQS